MRGRSRPRERCCRFALCRYDISSTVMFRAARCVLILAVAGNLAARVAVAQTSPSPPRVEAGLENAVKWKWRAVPSDPKDRALELPEPPPVARPMPGPALALPQMPDTIYEVKRGDALVLIARRFGVSVDQIKQANGLTSDLIRAGQTLRIPPPPRPTGTPLPKSSPVRAKSKSPTAPTEAELTHVLLRVFLDREQFSSGPITGKPSPAFGKVLYLYQSTHDDAKDDAALEAKARAAVGEVFVRYKLRLEDFRFIAPPRAETAKAPHESTPRPGSGSAPSGAPAGKPARVYEQLIGGQMLAYRSPWGFVAERFHCSEAYLRALNKDLPAVPAIGAEFRVPNVIPFEIEKALNEPLQPKADPNNPITAAVEGLAQLNIYRQGTLIAVYPLSSARPGLRGRGTWTILGAIPWPRLATRQEEWREPARKPAPLFGSSTPTPTPTPAHRVLASEQFLPPGPRNPVGVVWIDLAKSDNPEPLPYGLHGTSIPDEMGLFESLGGFRLTNWDIARAVRQLPFGTPLEWRP